jgi:hypothetical protein
MGEAGEGTRLKAQGTSKTQGERDKQQVLKFMSSKK